MIRVYTLPKEKVGNKETFKGIDLVHDACAEPDKKNKNMIVIMDTTDKEHEALSALAVEVRKATAKEKKLLPPVGL